MASDVQVPLMFLGIWGDAKGVAWLVEDDMYWSNSDDFKASLESRERQLLTE